MDLLGRLERALEDAVEGMFSRAFRTQLQPIEIAKRLTREVETHRAVSVSATYVPNVYQVHLAPETYQSFQPISGRLLAELEQYLREFTTERHYQLVGPITVRMVEEPGTKSSEMSITSSNDVQATPSSTPTPSILRSYPEPPKTSRVTQHGASEMDATRLITATPPTALEIVEGEGTGKSIPLADGLSFGRGLTNTQAFTDLGMSRNHAEVVWEEESWVLHDRGSTNGTYVNNRQITAHPLQIGERVKMGNVVMVVK